jgi:hypothetical protein
MFVKPCEKIQVAEGRMRTVGRTLVSPDLDDHTQ